MLSSSRRFIVPLFAFFSLFLAAVNAYDPVLPRGHANLHMKRVMRKRAPFPQRPGEPIVGAGPLPDVSDPAQPTPTPSPLTNTTAPALTTSTNSTTSTTTEKSTTSTVPRSTPSSVLSTPRPDNSTVSTPKETPSQTQVVSTSDTAVGVSTIFGPNRTHTASVVTSETAVPEQQGNTSSSQVKSTTMTVIVAIAASVGGVFIVWTIFRKWKLSRSKEFDRRLNPVDWQPTTGDDEEHIPGQNRLRPASPTSSMGHGHNSPGVARTPSSQGHSNPFDDFDSPVQSSAPVGGYADLARGTKPTQMQERLQHGLSYNQGATPVPLHHQGGYGGGY